MKNEIMLISGMDFSGKSTIIKEIPKLLRYNVITQEKLLSPPENNEVWKKVKALKSSKIYQSEWNDKQRSEYDWLVYEALKYDLEHYIPPNTQTIQDSVLLMKRLARTILQDNDKELLEKHHELVNHLPNMDSIFLTTTPTERLRRFNIRQGNGGNISRTDNLLIHDPEKFFDLSKIYQDQIIKRFPNTVIIDTTNATPVESAKKIIKEIGEK